MNRLRLTGRLERLEQSEVFASPDQLMRRLHVALNAAAVRMTGKLYMAARNDATTQERIFDEVSVRFIQKLSDVELDHLEAGLRGGGNGENETGSKAAADEPHGSAMTSEPLAEW